MNPLAMKSNQLKKKKKAGVTDGAEFFARQLPLGVKSNRL